MVQFGSKISFATTSLSYPIFAAEFDPYGRGYLVVGGGGGESKTGVPNKITVLDVSNRAAISVVTEIENSRDEDSVQCLGSLATKDGLITLAGINSSQAQQDAGNNEHFRAFDVKLPPRKRQKTGEVVTEVDGSIQLIGKRSLFKPGPGTKKETYQRVLRLSPANRQDSGSKRIGAIASSMSDPAEIIVFDATTALPDTKDVLGRIQLAKKDEAGDVDIAIANQNVFSIAWCTDLEISEQTFAYNFQSKKVQKTPKGPRRIHQLDLPDPASKTPKSRFRSLRFLDSQNILALINKGNKQGAELRIVHLYPTGPASTILQLSLPSHIKQAISLDVCALDSGKNGDRQFIIAVAGQDISIETYTVNFRGVSETFSRFAPYQTFRDVHKVQMTKICFSPFHAPVDRTKSTPEQFVRLASVSYGNSVVVDTFPVKPHKPSDPKSRYILTHPQSRERQQWLYIALISFMVLIGAYVGQGYIRSTDLIPGLAYTSPKIIYKDITSTVRDVAKEMQASAASIVESSVPSEAPGKESLQDLLNLHSDTKAVVVKDNEASELTVDVHDDRQAYMSQDPEAKHWDDLHEDQRAYWRQKLVQAGRWAESEGESVFKGVLWSQYAGLVGEAAGEILREL